MIKSNPGSTCWVCQARRGEEGAGGGRSKVDKFGGLRTVDELDNRASGRGGQEAGWRGGEKGAKPPLEMDLGLS